MSAPRALAVGFRAVARARHGSAIHEVGTVYRARLQARGDGPGPFVVPGEHEVLVRVSRGIGLPARLPDVLGLGVRLRGPDGPQDLLLDSCRAGVAGRHVPALRRDLRAGPLGSLLALRHDATTFHLAAFPAAGPPVRDHDGAAGLTFALVTAAPAGRWVATGRLQLDDVATDQAVRMTPDHTGLGVGLASPWWTRLRGRSYEASRREGGSGPDH